MVPCGIQVRKGLRVQTSPRPSSDPDIKLMDIAEDIGTVVPGPQISNPLSQPQERCKITNYEGHDCGGDIEDAAQELVFHQPDKETLKQRVY